MAEADKDETKRKEFNEHYLKHSLTAEFYSTISPTVSRIFMNKAFVMSYSKLTDEKTNPDISTCAFCGTVLTPQNIRVRIKPSAKLPTKLLKKLQRLNSNSQQMGKFQQKLLERARTSSVTKTVKCLTCNRSTGLAMGKKDRRIIKNNSKEIEVVSSTKKKKKRKKQKNNDPFNTSGILHATNPSTSAKESAKPVNLAVKKTNPLNKVVCQPPSLSAKKPKSKGGRSHNILQKMLQQQQEQKKNQSNALGDFLSSV